MSNSLIITLSTAGMALLICSCATSPTDKEKGEFPLVQTGEIKAISNSAKTIHSNKVHIKDYEISTNHYIRKKKYHKEKICLK